MKILVLIRSILYLVIVTYYYCLGDNNLKQLSKMSKDGYQIEIEILPSLNKKLIYKYRCLDRSIPMTYGKFLDLLSDISTSKGAQFRHIFIETIKNFPSIAFFFECISITSSEVNSKPIEFILMESNELAAITVDGIPFHNKFEHLDNNQLVISFNNLGGDSTLIVPCPIYINTDSKSPDQSYAHFAHFIRKGGRIQIDKLLVKIGEELKRILRESPNTKKYLSTSGLGVSYLHVRIDNVPKYYQYAPYKK